MTERTTNQMVKNMKELNQGLVQVYTGNGKGKTTASIGLAIRANGHGLNVYIGQFMKPHEFGEHHSLKNIDNIRVEQFGTNGFQTKPPSKEGKEKANEALNKIKERMMSEKYDIVIGDEICMAVDFGMISVDDLMSLIEEKPDKVELVLTGRNAPREITQKADLVTEMKNVKHPYDNGVTARKGIEK